VALTGSAKVAEKCPLAFVLTLTIQYQVPLPFGRRRMRICWFR
jgi:hypothetical protein